LVELAIEYPEVITADIEKTRSHTAMTLSFDVIIPDPTMRYKYPPTVGLHRRHFRSGKPQNLHNIL